jgi:hypothetical protein
LRTLHTPAGYLELALFAAPAIAAHVAVHLSFGASRPERQACVSGLTRLRQLAGGSLARVQSRI